MMGEIIKITLFLAILILSGCAGLSNSSYDLEDGYSVMYTSAHGAKIIYDETGQNTSGKVVVDEKVVRVNQNEQYIIAEQEKLNSEGKPSGELKYYIEDKNERSLLGANLTEAALNELKDKLNIKMELFDVTTFPQIK